MVNELYFSAPTMAYEEPVRRPQATGTKEESIIRKNDDSSWEDERNAQADASSRIPRPCHDVGTASLCRLAPHRAFASLRRQARITLTTIFSLLNQPLCRCNAMVAFFWTAVVRSVRKKQLPSAMVNPSRREGRHRAVSDGTGGVGPSSICVGVPSDEEA